MPIHEPLIATLLLGTTALAASGCRVSYRADAAVLAEAARAPFVSRAGVAVEATPASPGAEPVYLSLKGLRVDSAPDPATRQQVVSLPGSGGRRGGGIAMIVLGCIAGAAGLGFTILGLATGSGDDLGTALTLYIGLPLLAGGGALSIGGGLLYSSAPKRPPDVGTGQPGIRYIPPYVLDQRVPLSPPADPVAPGTKF